METDWKKVEVGLKQYKWIMEKLKKIDVSSDREFQKKFNHFYRMRQRSPEFYATFYEKLEVSKEDSSLTFGEALDYFCQRLNRVEASFSSKLVSTINPDMPVWDKEVLKNLGLKAPLPYDKNRLSKIKKLYSAIEKWYIDYLKTEKGKGQLTEFEKRFPNSGISNTKKVDLILWQTREK